MPLIKHHHSSNITKLLLLGESGSGKTGALCALAGAGYNLRIVDLDNGIDLIRNLLLAKSSRYPADSAERVTYQTITDPMRVVAGKLVPKSATVWQRTIKLLENWKTDSEDLGSILTWGPQDILVIDSLSFLCIAAMDFVLTMNARLGQTPHQSDWYQAQQLIEMMLRMIYDENVKCNVIITGHLRITTEEGQPPKATVHALGRALAPIIGRYFNSVLLLQTSGSGAQERRKLLTRSTQLIELKNTAPLTVKPEYPLETGLADYFRDVRSAGAGESTTQPQPSTVQTGTSTSQGTQK